MGMYTGTKVRKRKGERAGKVANDDFIPVAESAIRTATSHLDFAQYEL